MWFLLVAAAALAGGMNALAGGGTLVTFPSLLAFGVSPVAANATSTVALVPGGVSAFWGFRHDVAGDRNELMWMAIPSLVGGALGAMLVLWVGNRTFALVVPWLIYGATFLFVAQAPIRRWLDRRIGADGHRRRRALQVLMQFAISIYGGFFGAAMGILMLAMLGLVGHDNLSRMNGLKNFAGVAINLTAAGIFVLGGQVQWPLALAMMGGAIVRRLRGGARLATREPEVGARVRRGHRRRHGNLHAMRGALIAIALALSSTVYAAPTIDVYTMGQGDDLFSAFGHAAICVTDENQPRGRCYNYGTADFTTPVPLTWNFIRGRALFWVSTTDVPHMLHYYVAVGRAVWRQTLQLSPDEATRVATALAASAQEGAQVLSLSPLRRQLHDAHSRRHRSRHRRAAVARSRRSRQDVPPVGARWLRRQLAACWPRSSCSWGARPIGAPIRGPRCSCRRSCARR